MVDGTLCAMVGGAERLLFDEQRSFGLYDRPTLTYCTVHTLRSETDDQFLRLHQVKFKNPA
jgi:hypothetical protein